MKKMTPKIQVGFKFLELLVEKKGEEFPKLMKKLARRHMARMNLSRLPEEEQNPMDKGTPVEHAEEEMAGLITSSPDIDPRWLIAAAIVDEMQEKNFPLKTISKIEDAIDQAIALTR